MKLTVTLVCLAAMSGFSFGQQSPNYVKRQDQLKGIEGTFGETYSLKNGFNFSILSASYSHEPYLAWKGLVPGPTEKILILRIAIKNATPSDNFFELMELFSLVDKENETYTPDAVARLESKGIEAPALSLRPAQGIGQAALKDPLTVGFILPGKAVIDKIMVNQGRLNTSEKTLRFPLSEPPKPTDKPDTQKRSFIAPLDPCIATPSDPWGATVLNEGKGQLNTDLSTSAYLARVLDCLPAPDAVFHGDAAPEGKQYVVATLQITNVMNEEGSIFGFTSGVDCQMEVTDADGEHYRTIGFDKLKTDEGPNATLQRGESYKFRVFFTVPKEAQLAKLIVCADHGRRWGVPLK